MAAASFNTVDSSSPRSASGISNDTVAGQSGALTVTIYGLADLNLSLSLGLGDLALGLDLADLDLTGLADLDGLDLAVITISKNYALHICGKGFREIRAVQGRGPSDTPTGRRFPAPHHLPF